MTSQSTDDAVATSTLDDSLTDIDLVAVDELINNATRLINEVLSNRPLPPPPVLNPREDAIQQVQLFLNSIRDETNQDDDVVFVEERPGNAPPSTARTTTTIVDLCSPVVEAPAPAPTRRRGRRSSTANQIQTPTTQSEATPPKVRRRKPKNEPGTVAVVIDDSTSSIDEPTQTTPEGKDTLTCPICMTSVINRQPSSTICGHIFCQKCIYQAIRLTSKCPLCKAKLRRNQVHRLYF